MIKKNEINNNEMNYDEKKEYMLRTGLTCKDIFSRWLNKMKIQVKKSTYSNYYFTVYHYILPYLGELTAENITLQTFDKFIEEKLSNGRADKSGGLSSKTVRDIIFILKSAFKFAEKYYGIKNPCEFICCPKCCKNELQLLTNNEWRQLEKYINYDMNFSKLGILICMYTGIRLGEICALKWEDIDFEKGTLKVRKTIQRISNAGEYCRTKTKIIIDTPKSNSSVREIPLPSFLIKILKNTYKRTMRNSFILSGLEKYIEPRTYQYRFKKYLSEAKIKEVNFHSLRHSFATRCVENNFDIKSLSEILGHSSVEITLNRYVHSSMELKRKYMEKLGNKD